MTFYIYAWIASFFFGLIAIIAKLTSKYSISNAWLFNFLWALFSFLFTLPVALYYKAGFPEQWGNLLIAGVLSGLVYIFYILALYRLDVSVLSPLFSFRTALSVILGTFLLKEILSFQQFIFLILIFIAGFFVSYDEKTRLKSFFQKSIGIALILMLTLSFMGFFLNKAIAENNYWTVTLWDSFISLLVLIPTIKFFKKEIKKVSFKQIGVVASIGLFGTLGTLASNMAYAENISISSAIISLPISMLLAFLLSVFSPKLLERHTIKVYLIRFLAAAIMFYSALRLS